MTPAQLREQGKLTRYVERLQYALEDMETWMKRNGDMPARHKQAVERERIRLGKLMKQREEA